jgi:YgiT-type zinc finger domain-containing protein
MTTKPDPAGIPAAQVIAKLEAKLQAALDARGLRRCGNCRVGILKPDVRDVAIVRQSRRTVVRNIHGSFCNQCGEIEFDAGTDSAQRYASAGDRLVFRNRAAQKWKSLNPTHGLPGGGLASTLWHAVRDTWSGYFAPLWMGAWLLKYPFTQSRETLRVHKVVERTLTVMAMWDSDASVWVAWSSDVPGLITEAQTMFELSAKLKTLVPEILTANGQSFESFEFEVIVTQFEDRYPLDDGPLTEQQIAVLRADVKKHFPRGKLISRKDLFK